MISGNFWDSDVWSFIITLTLLLSAMMVANMLRQLIPALRKSLIPSSVLGGFMLLILNFAWRKLTGSPMFTARVMEMLTYHGLGLGFVAMTLRKQEGEKAKKSKYLDTGVIVVGGYALQGLIGIIITMVGSLLFNKIFFAAGLLLPMGYGQGPGQAYNWGHTYEVTYGFENGTSFGLTVAALGFIAASIGGIIYLYSLRRKGQFSGVIGENKKEIKPAHYEGENEIPLTESIDKLTVQVALVFVGYIAAYLFMYGINAIIDTGILGDFGANTLRPLIWGFNFLFGSLFGLLLKKILSFMQKKNVIHREYTNNFMQNRIAGFMFDIMVVASIAAIDLSAFTHPEFIVPLCVICLLGGVSTYWYLKILCPKVYPSYGHESFLSLYGMLTGTASTGVILLREKDPDFLTPAANDLVYQQPWAICFGFPFLLLAGVAPKGMGASALTVGVLVALFTALMLVLYFRNRKKKTKA